MSGLDVRVRAWRDLVFLGGGWLITENSPIETGWKPLDIIGPEMANHRMYRDEGLR